MNDDPQVAVRRVRTGDGEALHAIFVTAILTLAVDAYTPDQMWAWMAHITPSRLEARLMKTVSFVAEIADRPVGFGALDIEQVELDFLYTAPEFARQGIGRRLAQEIEKEADNRGIRSLELTASLNAVAIYERLGYQRLRDMEKTINGVRVPCVRMAKPLK